MPGAVQGTKPEHFAKIAYKNHKHSSNNPNSRDQNEYTLEEIMNSPMVYDPLTKLQCCTSSDGAACAILASEDFVEKHNKQATAVEIVAQRLVTDLPSSFNENSCMKVVGYDITKKAAEDVYKDAGISPDQVDVVELHDCFSTNELITYEALGLCPPGKAGEFIDRGDNTYGGKVVVNPSGGLISKGHPIGATGLAQCTELCWQLRGLANKRQVPGAKLGLQQNIGLGGAVVCTLYKLGFPQHTAKSGSTNLGQQDTPSYSTMARHQNKRDILRETALLVTLIASRSTRQRALNGMLRNCSSKILGGQTSVSAHRSYIKQQWRKHFNAIFKGHK